MRALTITLNAAIDATYVLDRLVPGDANRARRTYRMAGGKGNNVARVLAARGHAVTATGFLGGASGAFIERGLAEAGVTPAFAWLDARESRTCHAILEEATGKVTEVLEAGPAVSTEDGERFLEHLATLLPEADVVVISGSAPAGLDATFLERMARIVREGSDRMVVDSSGAALRALLPGRPDVIKPNAAELAALMGREASLAEQIAFARGHLIGERLASGGYVLISRGDEGAVLVFGDGALGARPPAIRPVNTVGCGDALLAGYVEAWLAGEPPGTSLAQAVAFGAAAALQPVAGVVDERDVERMRAGVRVSNVSNGVGAER